MLRIKTLKQTFSEYKHTIQQWMDTSVLDLLILRLKEKHSLNIQIFFHQIILRIMMVWFCLIFKINENNSIDAIEKTNLTEQTKFWLSEIIGI